MSADASTPGRRNIRVAFDFADAAVWYVWTDEPTRPDTGGSDFGVFATFGEAKAAALKELRRERARWTEAVAYHRSLTKGEAVPAPAAGTAR